MEDKYSSYLVEYLVRFRDSRLTREFKEFIEGFMHDPAALEYMLEKTNCDSLIIWHVTKNLANFPIGIIRRFADSMDWRLLSGTRDLTKDYVDEFHDRIYWGVAIKHNKVNIYNMPYCDQYIDWREFSFIHEFTTAEAIKWKDRIDWKIYCMHREVPESILFRCHDRIVWHLCKSDITPAFVKRHHDIIDWNDISLRAPIDIEFYNRYREHLNSELLKGNQYFTSIKNNLLEQSQK